MAKQQSAGRYNGRHRCQARPAAKGGVFPGPGYSATVREPNSHVRGGGRFSTAGESPFICNGADVIAVRDGLVARKDTYLDLAAYQRQAGAIPLLATGV